MTRAFGSPLRYIQGPGEFDHLPDFTSAFGEACILIDQFLFSELKVRLEKIYERCESEFIAVSFAGECCEEAVESIKAIAGEHKISVIVGIGGGKTMDVAKLCSAAMGLSLIIVPTSASTDAPVSEIAVLYTRDGEYIGSRKMKRNADLVLVDSEIIIKAPRRLFVAGMGDALATWFEAKACESSHASNYIGTGYSSCKAGMAIAEMCRKILFDNGYQALQALEEGIVNEALENVVEANTLLSGLGFLNTGLAAAHGIHSGLTALPRTHKFLHGEKVAFGIVCQLMMEEASDETKEETINFMAEIGLPVTLRQLDVEVTEENIMTIAEKTVEGPLVHHENTDVTVESLYHAIISADLLGRKYIQ